MHNMHNMHYTHYMHYKQKLKFMWSESLLTLSPMRVTNV